MSSQQTGPWFGPKVAGFVLVAVAIAGVAFVAAPALAQADGPPQPTEQGQNDTGQGQGAMAQVRVVHASPDAPAVDIYVDDEAVLENVTYGTLSDYLSVSPGLHTVTITEAGNESAVVYEQTLPVRPGTYTIAAAGEVSEGADRAFTPVILLDQAEPPEAGNALVRLAHLSPDAPTVDVTVNQTGNVLFDNVSFGNATEYQSVPAGNYTLDVRPATANESGEVVHSVNVSVFEGQAYTALAAGYLTPEDEPGNASFSVAVIPDMIAERGADDATTPPADRGPDNVTVPPVDGVPGNGTVPPVDGGPGPVNP